MTSNACNLPFLLSLSARAPLPRCRSPVRAPALNPARIDPVLRARPHPSSPARPASLSLSLSLSRSHLRCARARRAQHVVVCVQRRERALDLPVASRGHRRDCGRRHGGRADPTAAAGRVRRARARRSERRSRRRARTPRSPAAMRSTGARRRGFTLQNTTLKKAAMASHRKAARSAAGAVCLPLFVPWALGEVWAYAGALDARVQGASSKGRGVGPWSLLDARVQGASSEGRGAGPRASMRAFKPNLAMGTGVGRARWWALLDVRFQGESSDGRERTWARWDAGIPRASSDGRERMRARRDARFQGASSRGSGVESSRPS